NVSVRVQSSPGQQLSGTDAACRAGSARDRASHCHALDGGQPARLSAGRQHDLLVLARYPGNPAAALAVARRESGAPDLDDRHDAAFYGSVLPEVEKARRSLPAAHGQTRLSSTPFSAVDADAAQHQ